jgi:putative cell wall-binding protein
LRFRLSPLGRGGVAAIAAATVTAGIASFAAVPAAHATSTVTVTTYAGADRYGTSADIAEAKYPNGVTSGHVILASGANFPDALAANYLAGQLGAPVLLTPPTASDPDFPETTAALAKLLTGATKDVTIVGGTAAVGSDVMTALQGDGYTVNQIGGATRFDTAEMIDTQTGDTPGAGVSGAATAIIATGDNYPDALSAGPLAFDKHFPIILTDGSLTTLSPQAQSTLSTLAIKHVIIMGGSAAINAGINTQITGLGITIDQQFAGADRTQTASLLEAYETSTYGFSTSSVILASGGNYPDALSAGALGGDPQGILLTEPDQSLGTYTTTEMNTLAATDNTLIVVGGTAAVPTATVTAAQTALEMTPTAQTALPQLVSSSIVTTTPQSSATASNTPGTVVQFVFSQSLADATYAAADFKVWPADDGANGGAGFPGDVLTPAPAAGEAASQGGICGISAACTPSTNADAVNVLFSQEDLQNTTGTDSASDLTLATVASGAVTQTNGLISPDGNAAIGASTTTTLTAGVTDAPDLTTIGTPRLAANTYPDSSAIDLTFDKAAYPQGGTDPDMTDYDIVYTAAVSNTGGTAANGLTLLDSDGQEVACQGPGAGDPNNSGTGYTVPGYNPANDTVTIVCPNPNGAASQTMTASEIAYIVIQKDTVATEAAMSDTGYVENGFIEASSSPAQQTVLPVVGLSSVTLIAGTGTNPDQAVYTFNQAITSATLPTDTGLGLVEHGGGVLLPGGQTCEVTAPVTLPGCQVTTGGAAGDTTSSIDVYLPNGTLAGEQIVGGTVAAGSYTGSNADAYVNLDDELGAANSSTTGQVPGGIDAVQLTSATSTTSTNGLGSESITATWTFDFALTAPGGGATLTSGDAGAFHLYDADGTELTCADIATPQAAIGAGSADNTVSCADFVQGASDLGTTQATGTQLTDVALATVDYDAVQGNTAAGVVPLAPSTNPNPEGAASVSAAS